MNSRYDVFTRQLAAIVVANMTEKRSLTIENREYSTLTSRQIMKKTVDPNRPSAKERPRTDGRRIYTPPETSKSQQRIARAWINANSTNSFDVEALAVLLEIGYPIPVSYPAWKADAAETGLLIPNVTPDNDNVEKLFLDALNGIAWHDDTQVAIIVSYRKFQPRPCTTTIIVGKLPAWCATHVSKNMVYHGETRT